ncbi:MAG TPA: hypothetical protein VHW23_45945 [Kofleriaceae bacterium]|nr:hypothetical protein [Kofleriaceae bacterium]
MRRHRNPRQSLPNAPDLDNLVHLLRDNLGKADAFISSAEHQLEQAPSGDEDDDRRRQLHIEHLVESGKLAVHAAVYTAEQIDRHRSGA